jgi:serine protease Do
VAACFAATGEAHPGSERFWVEAKASKVRREHSEIAKVARRAMPAVVAITTRQEPSLADAAASGQTEPQKGLGSGFIIHPDGYILTSSHVVEGASEVKVSLLARNGRTRSYDATVIGNDPETDFALLKIDAGYKLPVLPLGSARDVEVADWVVVIGNPFGLSHSVTVGVVSYKGRTDVTPAGRTGYFDYLQTDASINPGNSGGPVLDLNGNVVAIANAVNTSGQGIGFALPIDMAKAVLPDLMKYGEVHRGWIGISVQDVDADSATPAAESGVVVSDVEENSPAEKAGLRVGDLIVGLGKAKVHQAHALRWTVATANVGRAFRLTVRRDGQLMTFRVRPAETQATEPPADSLLAAGQKQPRSLPAGH